MRYLILIISLSLSACSEDKPTASPEPVLSTVPHSVTGTKWTGVDYIEADTKWRILSISGDGLEISWILEFRNTGSVYVANVSVGRLVFEDKDGFQLGESVFYFNSQDFTVLPGSSRTRQGTSTIGDITDINIANSITRMGVWASFSQR